MEALIRLKFEAQSGDEGADSDVAALTISPDGDTFTAMNFGIFFEAVTDQSFPPGYSCAHVPSLGLTTHGLGVVGARAAAADLVALWIAEKRANGEAVQSALFNS